MGIRGHGEWENRLSRATFSLKCDGSPMTYEKKIMHIPPENEPANNIPFTRM